MGDDDLHFSFIFFFFQTKMYIFSKTGRALLQGYWFMNTKQDNPAFRVALEVKAKLVE